MLGTRRLLLMLLLGLALVGCSTLAPPRDAQTSQPTRTTVKLGRVVRGDITGALLLSGELEAGGHVIVSPRANGTLAHIAVQVGAHVKEGDTVAELDKALAEQQVQRAQLALSTAEARRAQLQSQARPEEVAMAQAMVNAAQARVNDLTQGASQSPQQALAALSAARQHLAELEGPNPNLVGQVAQSLDTAAALLDQAQRDPNNHEHLDQARAALDAARQQLAAARQPANPSDLQAAQEAVVDAERQMLLSSLAGNPDTVAEAQAYLEAAQQRLQLASSPASDAQVAAAQAEVDQASAALELARQALQNTALTSPIGGIVSQRFVDEGALVGPGVAILEIIPPDPVLELRVPSAEVANVGSGQQITVTVDAYPQESFTGVVGAVAPMLDPRDQTMLARATVSDPQGKLKAGMTAQASVATGSRQGVLLVPLDAVVTQGDTTFAWVVVDGRTKRQPLKLGLRDAQHAEVVDGLFEGAAVVESPPALNDGAYVLAQ